MKKYDDSVVAKVAASERTTTAFGVTVHLKDSPERPAAGHLDPYEVAIRSANWAAPEDKKDDAAAEKPAGNPFENMPIEHLVGFMREMMGFANLNLNETQMITKYEELELDGRKVGLWRYYKRKGKKEPKSCLVYIHGGGWIGGDVYTVENPCRLIAELADAVVFNVDYGLAPESPFPGGMMDCYNAVKHIYEHAEEYGIDKNKISVAGDSAGGNLTAAVSMKARDEGIPMVAQQIMLYPAVTFGRLMAEGYEWKAEEYEVAPGQEAAIQGCLMLGQPSDLENGFEGKCYFTDLKDAESPYASPMMAESHAGLPKAIILTAEYDGLRLQGEFYGKQLMDAGVDTTIYRYEGLTHAFLDRLGFLPQTEEVCQLIARALNEV